MTKPLEEILSSFDEHLMAAEEAKERDKSRDYLIAFTEGFFACCVLIVGSLVAWWFKGV